MKSLRYLNSMLTIIAVLLSLNVYAMWTVTPGGAMLSATSEARAEAGGIPNAAKQRQDALKELKNIASKVDALNSTLTSGSVRVRLEAAPGE